MVLALELVSDGSKRKIEKNKQERIKYKNIKKNKLLLGNGVGEGVGGGVVAGI